MNEWNVVTVIITIIGLIVTVGTPALKLNSSITSLTSELKTLIKGLDEFKDRYKEQLKALNDKDDGMETAIRDHEGRISSLEGQMLTEHTQKHHDWK